MILFKYILICFFLGILNPLQGVAQKYSDILMDAHTGEVLHQTDPDGHRYPASLTKMMTLYILFEHLKNKCLTLLVGT